MNALQAVAIHDVVRFDVRMRGRLHHTGYRGHGRQEQQTEDKDEAAAGHGSDPPNEQGGLLYER